MKLMVTLRNNWAMTDINKEHLWILLFLIVRMIRVIYVRREIVEGIRLRLHTFQDETELLNDVTDSV